MGDVNTTSRGKVANMAPARQPVSVHQLAPKLFAPYTIDGGNVLLAGCTLEDRPLLRLSFEPGRTARDATAGVEHVFFAPDGRQVDRALCDGLHLDDVTPITARPPELPPGDLAPWVASSKESLAASSGAAGAESATAVVVWCKYAEGKLSVRIGEQSVEIPFAGWAQLLADGSVVPPPFACPETGIRSYHLAATDDGLITAAEAVGVCEESNRRVLDRDLETCSVTGKRVHREHLRTCPVTEERLLPSALRTCVMCRQQVSPAAIKAGRCAACRSLRSVPKDDPRMARVLDEFPVLARWRGRRLAETAATYVLTADGWLRRMLLVVDRRTLQVQHVAAGYRFFSTWTEVPEQRWAEFLKEKPDA